MPALKRPRGATPSSDNKQGLIRLLKERKPLLAALAIGGGIVVWGLSITSSDSPTAIQIEQAESSAATTNVQAAAAGEASATPVIEPTPVSKEKPWVDQLVKSGDNLSLIFQRAGYSDRNVHEVVSQSTDGKLLERIFPGQTISFQADDAGDLLAVRHLKSQLETVSYQRDENGFVSTIETRTPELREAWATGVITSSLFLAGQEAGLSQNMIMELANIFGGVIDFVLDPRTGDTIQLTYEDLYLDGEKFDDGKVIAASFTNQGETFNAYRYTDAEGEINYYNDDGVSMRKAFLMAPVDFTRISSSFNLRRMHPIYKTRRPHRGTDYAASRGTPVFAAGDGRVSKAGYNSANGNYIFIQHGEQYVTKYLHLHKRNVKTGQRVSQSQVIGTVGSTGASTAPHLHYEFLMNGVHRNPRTIHKQLPKAKSLPQDEMERFRTSINRSSLQLTALRSDKQLAMNEDANPDSVTP
ncbi:MAG: murein DD-endopeptidase MepM/ murein hydrolase activator NlpD [Halioglobus sp.]|jgi:murein DD-endopeptidase MepM/ murein hydrolase activator NlpD